MDIKIMIGVVLLLLVVGTIANGVGLTAPLISGPVMQDVPDFLLPLVWAFNALGAFLCILTFQVEGIPPAWNTIIFVPLMMGIGWMILKLVRGGG